MAIALPALAGAGLRASARDWLAARVGLGIFGLLAIPVFLAILFFGAIPAGGITARTAATVTFAQRNVLRTLK